MWKKWRQLPTAADDISAEDMESLRWMYEALVKAAVETRKDMDQIAFRYIATLTTVALAIASTTVTIRSIVPKLAAVVIVGVLVGVAMVSLRTRSKVYSAINDALLGIEAALGGFREGRFVQERALFDWGCREGAVAPIVYGQVLPHLAGVAVVGAFCCLAILVDGAAV